MSFFDYEDGRGSDQYVSDLLSLIQAGKGQGMTPPSQMQVNVRSAPQMSMGGGGGMTEEQAEDAEKAQIISAIGGALSGGIGAYGQANGTGAYAQGGALGGQGAAAGATAAPTTATPALAASNTTSTYNKPRIDNFGKPAPSTRPSYMLQDPGIYDENAYTGLSEQNRRVANSTPDYLNAQFGQTKSSPTGASAIKDPAILALAGRPNAFNVQNPSEETARAVFRGRRPGGMSQEDAWQLYAGNGAGQQQSNALTQGAMPPEFVLSGGVYNSTPSGLSAQSTQYSLPYGIYSGQGYR